MEELKLLYDSIKPEIEKKLLSFQSLWNSGSDIDIFTELCFCICTPQSNAQKCWAAATRLKDLDYLLNGNNIEIEYVLKEAGVRFHKNKAKYILANREQFGEATKFEISKYLSGNIADTRNRLAHDIKGYGLKEASHFLRNIGFGEDIAILDRHILRRLSEYGVIPKVPEILTAPVYHEVEINMKSFAKDIGVPLDALDFCFWSQTHKGEIFK
jgi:N-glycosylase/DNA lyase